MDLDKIKTKIRGLLRVIFAALLVWILSNNISFDELRSQLVDINIYYFVLFLFISLPMIWASCVKWSLFLEGEVSILSLMRLYTMSYFVNLFAPSTLGGDVARSVGLGKKIENQKKALIATFFERLTGLLMMLGLSALSLILNGELLQAFGIKVLVVLLWLIFVGSLLFFARVRLGIVNVLEFLSKYLGGLIAGKLLKLFSEAKKEIIFPRGVIIKSFLWAFVFHALTIINTYLAGKCIGVQNLSFLSLTAVVPMVLLVLTVPLSPGGLGVQEGAFVFLLSQVGIPPAQGLAISLLLRLKNLILSGIGGLLLVFRKKQ